MDRQRPIGPLTPCKCGRQPKYFETFGGRGHALECPPCSPKTARHPTLQQAVEEWEAMQTVTRIAPAKTLDAPVTPE